MSTSTITKDGRPVSEYVGEVEGQEIDDVRSEATRMKVRQPIVSRTMRNHNGERSGPVRSMYTGDPRATHVFMFKSFWPASGKMPSEASGLSAYGMAEFDKLTDCWKCHECAEWWPGLGQHVQWRHKDIYPTFRDYKIKHGISLSSGLVSPKGKEIRSRTARKHLQTANAVQNMTFEQRSEAGRKGNESKKQINAARRCDRNSLIGARWGSPEMNNLLNLCRAQTERDGRALYASKGHPPTVDELNAYRNDSDQSSLEYNRLKFLYGTIYGFFSVAGIPLPKRGVARTPELRAMVAAKSSQSARDRWSRLSDEQKAAFWKKGAIARGGSGVLPSLTHSQIQEIRAKYVPRQYGLKLLAKEYGASVSLIHNIVTRKTHAAQAGA